MAGVAAGIGSVTKPRVSSAAPGRLPRLRRDKWLGRLAAGSWGAFPQLSHTNVADRWRASSVPAVPQQMSRRCRWSR